MKNLHFTLILYSIPLKNSIPIYLEISPSVIIFPLSLLSHILILRLEDLYFLSLFFFFNNKVSLTFKRSIIQLFIISKVLYFAPLLDSNKKKKISKNAQSLMNIALLGCIDSASSNKEDSLNIEIKKKKKNVCVISRGTRPLVFMPYFVILQVFPIVGFCTSLQIKSFLANGKNLKIYFFLVEFQL